MFLFFSSIIFILKCVRVQFSGENTEQTKQADGINEKREKKKQFVNIDSGKQLILMLNLILI